MIDSSFQNQTRWLFVSWAETILPPCKLVAAAMACSEPAVSNRRSPVRSSAGWMWRACGTRSVMSGAVSEPVAGWLIIATLRFPV